MTAAYFEDHPTDPEKVILRKPPFDQEVMTFQEQVKALPEEDRVKFFRGIMAVVDAGYKAGIPAEELAKMYADTYKQTNEMMKAREA
jgi:N-acetyl-gamma-glutamylphosphate reductase